jgi:hypothetical protein
MKFEYFLEGGSLCSGEKSMKQLYCRLRLTTYLSIAHCKTVTHRPCTKALKSKPQRIGMALSVAAHPIRVLHEAGVRVTVNADDPLPFATTVTEEASDPSRHARSRRPSF